MIKSYVSLKHGINFIYNKHFLTQNEAHYFYQQLNTHLIYNSKEKSSIFIHGKYVQIPREQVAYGDSGTFYEFSGNKVTTKRWNSDNVGKLLLVLKNKVEIQTGRVFNFVLVNKYKDGNSYIGYHSDDERNLYPKSSIVGISLGGCREFQLKCKSDDYVITEKLHHGSLVEMNYPTNTYWRHSVPKRTKINQPRISLTFRCMKML